MTTLSRSLVRGDSYPPETSILKHLPPGNRNGGRGRGPLLRWPRLVGFLLCLAGWIEVFIVILSLLGARRQSERRLDALLRRQPCIGLAVADGERQFVLGDRLIAVRLL